MDSKEFQRQCTSFKLSRSFDSEYLIKVNALDSFFLLYCIFVDWFDVANFVIFARFVSHFFRIENGQALHSIGTDILNIFQLCMHSSQKVVKLEMNNLKEFKTVSRLLHNSEEELEYETEKEVRVMTYDKRGLSWLKPSQS